MEKILDLKTIYPPESNIVQIEGSLKEDHVSSIRLKCATKEEFLRWLCNHQLLSGVTFRVLKTRPSVGKCVLYSAVYRCHHNTHPSSHSRVKNPSAKHTGCEAKLTVSIKSPTSDRRVRSEDILRCDYPTIVTARHKHNHVVDAVEALRFRDPTDAVKLKFLELFKSHRSPAKALKLYKEGLQQENKDNYFKVLADRSICPDMQWVYRLYYSTFKKGVDSDKHNIQDEIDYTPISTNVKTSPDNPETEQTCLSNESVTIKDCEQKLSGVLNNIKLHLQRNPVIFADAINKFCSTYRSLKCERSKVSALYSFGRQSNSPLRAKKSSTTVSVQSTAIMRRKLTMKGKKGLKNRRSVVNKFSSEHGYARSRNQQIKIEGSFKAEDQQTEPLS